MMKRNLALLLSCLLTALLAACSAGGAPSSAPGAPAGGTGDYAMENPAAARGEAGFTAMDAAPQTSQQSTAIRSAKLIRRANLQIQALAFSDAVAALEDLTARLGGYIEDASVSGGDYYEKNAMRAASFTIRVPKDQYDPFLNAAGNVGHLVSKSQTQEDVGEAYHDAELRLKTQQVKQERLLNLLSKAEKMEDIIDLENALSETEYQIDQYTTELKRYDSLVDFATIQVDLSEVLKLDDTPAQTVALGSRMGAAFGEGFRQFGEGVSNLAVWCAYHFVGLMIFAAVVAVAGVAVVRLRRKKTAPEAPKDGGGEKS